MSHNINRLPRRLRDVASKMVTFQKFFSPFRDSFALRVLTCVPPSAGKEPPGRLEEEEGTSKEQKSQGSPASWQPAAGVQSQAAEEYLVRDAHLARQAFPHGKEVGLLSRLPTNGQVLPAVL